MYNYCNFISHQITPEGMVYSKNMARVDIDVEKFVLKEIKKALRKSKYYEFKNIPGENNIFQDLSIEMLKDCNSDYFVNSTQLLAAELSSMVGDDEIVDVIFAKYTIRKEEGFAVLFLEHNPQMRSVAEYKEDNVEVVFRVNENVLKSRSGCVKAAIVYRDIEGIKLKIMDLDVDKNKVKLEDSNFINGFVKAEPIKDDAYMSELFYKETEKYFNKVERVKPDEKMNILLGLTYEIKENSGKEFSIEDFAQVYLPSGTEKDYLTYLREKGVEDYFTLTIKNKTDRQLKTYGVNVKVDAALLDDPNKVKIVKNGNSYDLVIRNIEYLY